MPYSPPPPYADGFDTAISVARDYLKQSSETVQPEERAKLDNIIQKLNELEKKIEILNVAGADPKNIQEVAASQLTIIKNYYESVLDQAQQSFRYALVASGIGLIFFIAAVSFLLLEKPESVSTVSLISGALIEVIAAINFYLYGRASIQFAKFHTRLDRTQNFLLANSVCENIEEGEKKELARTDLMRIIANASVTLEIDAKNR